MEDINKEEAFFREILSKSKLNVPFSDFDEKVMLLIDRKMSKKSSITRELKLSWIFFLLGSTVGIIISLVLPKIPEPILGIDLDKLAILFQIIFALLFVTQLDNLIKFYKGNMDKTKR